MSFDSSVPPPLIEGSKKELPSLLSLNVEPPAELILGRNEEFGEEKERKEVKLPVALEQALAFKSERAKQIGVNPEDIASVDPIEETNIGQQLGNIYDDDEEEEEDECDMGVFLRGNCNISITVSRVRGSFAIVAEDQDNVWSPIQCQTKQRMP
uniref:Uncharacterized protein n=1 Tax=Cacopsylla melanoneura TaxID=428564 RepID=A0A8D8TYB5_9HEMI